MAKDSPKNEGKPVASDESKAPVSAPEQQPTQPAVTAPVAKPRKLQTGHVRVRALKGVLALEGFYPQGQEFSLDAAEAERREKRGEVELID